MKYISPTAQLEAIDVVIDALRRGMLPPKSQCTLLADRLGVVRDRVANHKARMDEKDAGRFSRNEIAALYNAERAR